MYKLVFQAKNCKFTKSNTLQWVIFKFFKLYKWCQIAQSVSDNVHQKSTNGCGWIIRENTKILRKPSQICICIIQARN